MSTHQSRSLFEHQTISLSLLRQSVSSGYRRPVLQLPTGGGKTVVAVDIIRNALLKGGRVIFTVPSKGLIKQTVDMLWSEGIRHVGVMQADHPMTNAMMPVQVCTVQTLMRRKLPEATVVIVDECHLRFKFLTEWMAKPEWANVPFIGLTATPWSRGLGKDFSNLVIGTTTEQLINTVNPITGRTFLAPFRVFAPDKPNLAGIKIIAGDYHEGQLSERMQAPQLVANVVDTWQRLARTRKTLVFAVDRAHASALHEKFCAAGIAAEYVDAFTERDEREAIKGRMESGQTEVVVNIGCLTTGCDWPFVDCIVLARPTKSEMLYVQIVGRGLRSHPGKVDCLVLDHSSTTLNLGFVTDIHHEQLCDGKPNTSGKRVKKEAQPHECMKCAAVIPAKQRVCPECGHELKKVSKVEEVEGELKEVTKGKMKASKEEKQRWFGMLYTYALSKGFSEGWAAHKYRDKFGVWPTNVNPIKYLDGGPFVMGKVHPLRVMPDAEVMAWITSRNIARAKSKLRHNPLNPGAPL